MASRDFEHYADMVRRNPSAAFGLTLVANATGLDAEFIERRFHRVRAVERWGYQSQTAALCGGEFLTALRIAKRRDRQGGGPKTGNLFASTAWATTD